MVQKCLKCHRPAVTFIRYNGTHLCNQHLLDYVERRVKKEIKKQGKIDSPQHIGVALSGGKDSTVALYLTHKIYHTRPDVNITVLSVDEGIQGYRNASLASAKKNCKQLGIDHHIIRFQTVFGTTMDHIAQRQDALGECTFCGVFRRFCLNTLAKQVGVDRLITGHNLDDMAQSILMNFVNSDVQKLARLGPHRKVQPGLVPRMLPLRSIPEKEVMLYALLAGIEFHMGECPYAVRALRGQFRDIIDNLEEQTPGSRHSILNSYDNIRDCLENKYPSGMLELCEICGEPTSQQLCKACLLKKRLDL